MDGPLRQNEALVAVVGIRGDRADHVARVDVLDRRLLSQGFEMILDLLDHEVADRRQLPVPAGVNLGSI